MSVLQCNRWGCENIWCDRYSHKYGYICNECFSELLTGNPFLDIDEFMDSPKDQPIQNWADERYSFLNKIFPMR